MRALILIAILLGTPVAAEDIKTVDATQLTVAELMALAAAERDNPNALSCCDWGGLGCVVHRPGTSSGNPQSDPRDRLIANKMQ